MGQSDRVNVGWEFGNPWTTGKAKTMTTKRDGQSKDKSKPTSVWNETRGLEKRKRKGFQSREPRSAFEGYILAER